MKTIIYPSQHFYEIWNGFEWSKVFIQKKLELEVDDKGQFWLQLPNSGAKLLCRFVQWPLPEIITLI